MIRSAFVLILLLGALPSRVRSEEPDSKGLDFFERKIRPVLVEHCYSCHSADAERVKKLKGGLRVDDQASLRQGGDSGPAVVPGQADESTILDALRYDDVTKMPPKGKLPENVIADFEAWIAMGAPDPRLAPAASAPSKPKGLDLEEARRRWPYRLPVEPALPAVRDLDWPRTDIDRFLLARLEAKGLRPAADADRTTLIRRLSFDLAGLPPTPEEIDAFLADDAPDAYERLVERLLDSPRFGERWGRHWLDVARFGESLTLRGFVFKVAWRYRDYVIDAFNADLPFDQFVREQVAGDLLAGDSLDERRRQRVATAFLTIGNTNLEDQDKAQLRMDVVDEQLDTIGKAFLGQTIGCARCHDHKFDPIPTRDYYALAGILRNVKTLEHANVSKWLERPLPAPPEVETALAAHARAVAALEARIKDEKKRSAADKGKGKGVVASQHGPVAPGDLPGVVVDDAQARKVGAWVASRFSGTFVGTGYLHDDNAGKGEKTLTFQPDLPEAGKYEVWLAYSHGQNRAGAVPVTIFSADGEKTVTVDMRDEPPLEGRFVSLGRHQFERNGQGYVLVSNEGTSGIVSADAVVFLPAEMLATLKPAETQPKAASPLKALEAELKRLKAGGPKPDLAMAVVEESEIGDTKVHVRGSVHNLGEAAPRGFLRVATHDPMPAFSSAESGRRELADWLASDRNPLTARVFVNRAWHWLFGAGLVRTTDNFGTAGEPPSHPELLDHLALRFVADGWSVKALVRRIVLSRAYRLSTDDRQARAVDPENRLLSHAHRRRLDAECLRDAMLAAAGNLRSEMGGPAFPDDLAADYGFKSAETRRAVYVPVFRNALPDLFEAFDFADPSMVTGQRNVSTVAPQALFLRNNPFVLDQARRTARRLLGEPAEDDAARIDRAYRLILGRPPRAAEGAIARAFLEEAQGGSREEAWASFAQALFGSLDFRYVN